MSQAKVAQVKDDAILRNGLIPTPDELFVHFSSIGKGPSAETDDVLMTEMGIRGKPKVLGFKFINNVCHHILIYCLRHAQMAQA